MNPYFEQKKMDENALQKSFDCVVNNHFSKKYVPPHWHDYIEILYLKEGEMTITFGHKNIRIGAKTLVIFDAGEVHSTLIHDEKPLSVFVLKFVPELFSGMDNHWGLRYILPFIHPNIAHQKVFGEAELSPTGIFEKLEELEQECVKQQFGYELAVYATIYQLFLWIVRNRFPFDVGQNLHQQYTHLNKQQMQEIFTFIDTHYQEEITLNQLARLSQVSYSYFSRSFKRVVGITFKEYLNHVRIKSAEKLLVTTTLNVTEVAQAVGFSDTSYFILQFKKFKNISPLKYRKILLNGSS